MLQQFISLVIFRQDTSIINLLMYVPWPLCTCSSTNTRWLLFASNNISSFTSTVFKYHPCYLYLELSCFRVYIFVQTNLSHYIHLSLSGVFSTYIQTHICAHSFTFNLWNHFAWKTLPIFSHSATQTLHLATPSSLRIHKINTAHLLTATERHCCCCMVVWVFFFWWVFF